MPSLSPNPVRRTYDWRTTCDGSQWPLAFCLGTVSRMVKPGTTCGRSASDWTVQHEIPPRSDRREWPKDLSSVCACLHDAGFPGRSGAHLMDDFRDPSSLARVRARIRLFDVETSPHNDIHQTCREFLYLTIKAEILPNECPAVLFLYLYWRSRTAQLHDLRVPLRKETRKRRWMMR